MTRQALGADLPRSTARTGSVTAVVVTYHSEEPVARLLPTLDEGFAGVERWQLVVVDNDSTDATLETVRRLRPDARIVEMGRNAGYAAAINAGARLAADGDVLLVLNPDVRLRPGAVRHLLDGLDEPGTGIAVPRLVDEQGRTAPSLRRDPSVRGAWLTALIGGHRADRIGVGEIVRDPAVYEATATVDWATGAAMAISAECRRRVGEWEESYFLYSEEVDYCQRTRDQGLSVRYVPEAVAEHDGGPYGQNLSLWKLVVRNRVTHFARRNGRLRSRAYQAAVATGEAIRALRSPAGRVGFAAARTAPTRGVREPGYVWFAAQDWWYHNRAHSDFQLMQEVARYRPVLLVNSLGLRMPRPGVSSNPGRRIGRKLRSMAKLVRRPVPGLPRYHVMTPLMLPLYGPGTGARLNAWFIRQQVRLVARLVGVGPDPVIALTIPTAWPVVRRMRRSALVFNRSDLHSAFPEADGRWVASLEEDLLRASDVVLYVSHELMTVDADQVGDRAVFLGHGVDLDHFAMLDPSASTDAPEPPEMRDIPRPRIGFFGGIDDYVVDVELFTDVARGLPDASVVLVGDATVPMDDLVALPNVHWLGFQPYELIPAFGRTFDVALMPWRDNEWIRFANPIKLKEYLALGLPVVSTDYPEARHGEGQMSIAEDRAQFVDLVRAALSDPGDPAARRASVLSSSWQARARFLTSTVDVARRS